MVSPSEEAQSPIKMWLKDQIPISGGWGCDGGRHQAVLGASCIPGPIPSVRLQGLGGTTFLGHGDLFIDVSDDKLIYIVVGVVCIVLALLVAAILYLIRTKQIKGKGAKCVAGRHLLPAPFFLSFSWVSYCPIGQ